MTDPTNMFAMDDIKFMTGYNVEPVVASDVAVAGAIQKYYANVDDAVATGPSTLEIATRELADMPHLYDDDVKVFDDLEEVDTVNLQRQGGEAPVVRLVNVLLASAIHKGASDVHVESYEKEFRIRFRIDGTLYTVMTPPLKMREAVTSRLKIMAKLNIAEKRLPQDGRIRMRFRDQGATREIDLRVSLKRPRFSWTRIKGESNVQGGGGNGSVEGRGTGRGIGADGGSPEGDWSPCRRRGGRGGLPGAGAAVERQPEARRGAAATAWRIAGDAVP